MIRAEDHMQPCNHRSAGECYCSTFAEVDALQALVTAAGEVVQNKLVRKMAEGYSGWDDPEKREMLRRRSFCGRHMNTTRRLPSEICALNFLMRDISSAPRWSDSPEVSGRLCSRATSGILRSLC